MTVSTTLNRKSYLGDSTTVAFATEFMFLEDADLDVYLVSSTGTATLLTIDTHYTVAGAGSLSGGTVTMVTPPATGERLVIARNIESTQEVDLETTSDMPPASIERMVDKLTMLVQQNSTAGQRVITIPITDSELISTELPAAAARAGKVLSFDSVGAPQALDIATTETSMVGDGLEIDVNTLKVTADVERTTNKGQADGYAELDSSGVVPDAQLNGKAKVSSNDTTAGYLNGKLVAGSNITITEGNDAGNETLEVAATVPAVTDSFDKLLVKRSATQSINGLVRIELDSETFDTGGIFSSFKATPTVAGYYLVNAQLVYETTGIQGHYVNALLYKNGSAYLTGRGVTDAAAYSSATINGLVYCDGVTDYLELYASHSYSSSLNITTDSFMSIVGPF